MRQRVIIFTLITLIIIIALASIPKIGWQTGGYSPEELEREVINSANQGGGVRLANIKYNPVFWWPFTKTIYNKSASSQAVQAFLICLPYWIIVSLFFALIMEGIIELFINFQKWRKKS